MCLIWAVGRIQLFPIEIKLPWWDLLILRNVLALSSKRLLTQGPNPNLREVLREAVLRVGCAVFTVGNSLCSQDVLNPSEKTNALILNI